MKERVEKLVQTVDRLSLRERLFLFAAMLTVLSGAWEALLAAPLDAREQAAGNKIAALEQRLGTLNESITTTADGMNESLPSALDRLRALRDRVAKGDEEVKLLTSDLVDPAQMRSVLEELLQRQSGLRLVSATNLEPRPLLEDAPRRPRSRPATRRRNPTRRSSTGTRSCCASRVATSIASTICRPSSGCRGISIGGGSKLQRATIRTTKS